MAHFENVIVREFEFNSQEEAFAAISEGGELYEYVQEGYTDADGRQLTKAEIEYLIELGKWILRLVFGIPVP